MISKSKLSLKVSLIIFTSVLLVSGCNSGGSTSGTSLQKLASKIGIGSADSVHFNCSANDADVCNGGGSISLKIGGSGSKQGLKLIVPAAGYGVIKLAIEAKDGQPQDKVKFSSGVEMTCDFSSSTSCPLTVDATNGEAGKNVKVVALKDGTSVASIGVTIKDGVSPTPTPTPSDDGYGTFSFKDADKTIQLTDADINITKETILNLTGSVSNVISPFKAVIEFRSNTDSALQFVDGNADGGYDCSFDNKNTSCTIRYKLVKTGEILSTPIDIKNIDGTSHQYNLPAALPIIKIGQSTGTTPNKSLAVYADHVSNDGKHVSYFLRSNSYDHFTNKNDLYTQVFDNIRQSDPVGFERYFATNKKVRIIDVIVGSAGSEDIQDFGLGVKTTTGSDLALGDIKNGYYDNYKCYTGLCKDSYRVTPTSDAYTFKYGSSDYSYQTQIISYSDLNGITNNGALAKHFELNAIEGFMFDEASNTDVDRVYIIHCASGADRTGTGAAMLLGYSWKASNVDDADLYRNALYPAFVVWSNVFTVKKEQTSNKLADPDITVNPGIYVILRDIVGLTIDASKYPTHTNLSQYSGNYLPEEYSFTAGLCAGDTPDKLYSGCTSYDAGKLNIKTTKNLTGFDKAYLVTRNGDGTISSVTLLGEPAITAGDGDLKTVSIVYDRNLSSNTSIYLARSQMATVKPYFVNYLVVTGK